MIRSETLKALEFEKVLKLISGFSKSAAGRKAVLDIRPLGGREEIATRAGIVGEVRRLSQEGNAIPLSHFEEISKVLERVRPEGAILEPKDFLDIRTVLGVISDISSHEKAGKQFPLLDELTTGLTGFPDLLDTLNRTFDSEGKVVDDASAELYDIRKRIKGLNARIGKRLKEIVREEEVAPFLQDDFITRRGERWVIPVRMDSKGMVQGVVHDVSNTGETAFMEPLEIIGLSNELGNLIADEKAEVIRILKNVCGEIREAGPELLEQYRTLVYIDLLNSIASYAEMLDMSPADINESSLIRLRGARHPLLMAMQGEGAIRGVVPLDVHLEGKDRVMVITGPNAGGKTIAIKTVGLLILMAMSGIPIPADTSSTLPLVTNLLVDIGDEQSIESSLSTFSGHISRISRIINESGGGAVVLLDEIGTGTEPAQGAAIACAILNELSARGSLVFATTHLTDIIGFIYKTPGMINASMEFDQATHSPLYRLKEGEPGQSHALETARRYGLPKRVTDFAGKLMGGMNVDFHEILGELKEKGARYDELRAEVEQERRELKEREGIIGEKLGEAEAKRRRAYEEGLREAHEVIVDAKREVRSILESAKKSPRVAIARLEEKRQEIAERLKDFEVEEHLEIDRIKVGDTVFVRSIGSDGTVTAVNRKKERLEVASGGITFKVPLSDAGPARGRGKKEVTAPEQAIEAEEVPPSIKLLGLRAEEALSKLEAYIDRASMSGRDEVTIIHGVGTGALIRAVRGYIETHPNVKSFRRGERSEGGDGVTVVRMR